MCKGKVLQISELSTGKWPNCRLIHICTWLLWRARYFRPRLCACVRWRKALMHENMTCPLCASDAPLVSYPVSGGPDGACVEICEVCITQIDAIPEASHWRGLASAMWDENPPVQVLAVRMLGRLSDQGWARDLSDQVYLDDETQAWVDNIAALSQHKDSNGVTLNAGDTVVLIKDLPVKGAGFTAKRGTSVRSISLVADNTGHIEGRVEGQRIVILTEFVKKK